MMQEIYFKGTKLFEFKDSNAIQILGSNTYLIRIIIEIYYKILTGYKFSDVDMDAMNGYYPEVKRNGKTLKKNDIQIIKISDIVDIFDQLTVKKDSALLKYISSLSDHVLVSKSLEKIDESLTELSIVIDDLIKERIILNNLLIQTDINDVNLNKIIKEFIEIYYANQHEQRAPLWLLKELEIIDLFMEIINLVLEDGKDLTVILDKLDSKINLEHYNYLLKKLYLLTEEYFNCKLWIVPSSKDGILLNYSIFSNTYAINEEIIAMGDFETTYESICRNYPDNNMPSEDEVMKSLLQLIPFHSYEKEYSPSKETIIMSVFLDLLGEDTKIKIKNNHISNLEFNYLTGGGK